MKLTAEEVEAALYAADPVRWPPNFSMKVYRVFPTRYQGRSEGKKYALEYG